MSPPPGRLVHRGKFVACSAPRRSRANRALALGNPNLESARQPLQTMCLPYPPPYQDLQTLAEHNCTGESTIENWVQLGLILRRRKSGDGLWRWEEVEQYLCLRTIT
jgi:hypothetical protein